ncbi:MAG: TolC family protein [Candidatus Omnitrophota bacterium]
MRLMYAVMAALFCCTQSFAGEVRPLTLAGAVMRVVTQGHDLRMADKAIDAAKAQVKMARSPLLPQVSAFAGENFYAYQPAAVNGGQRLNTSEKTFVSMGVDVYQTVFDFGATRIRHKAAAMLAQRASDEAGGIRNQVVLSVIASYINVLQARRLMDVARHELTTLASHMKEVAILYYEGVATRNEILSVRVRFNQARQKLIVARSHEKVVFAGLKQCLSWNDDQPLIVKNTWPVVSSDMLLKDAIAAAMSSRYELHGLDKAVLAADFDEASTAASDKPSLFVRGGYNYADNRYQARDDNWQATVGVKLSVFNGGLTRASVAKARADKGRLMEERRQLEERLRFDVEKAYWEMKNASARMLLNETSVRQADENARVARIRYHEGAGTSVEFLDALVLRTAAETDLGSGVYEYQRAQAMFLYTMGKDLVAIYGQEEDHENLSTR